ncbi:MAG: MazG family protein [Cyanobacteria bacterium RYN_339]|nr:MazG family protein [Cyanobacteria bacterium RYN_339]
MTIHIVGLGPGDPALLTMAAHQALEQAPEVVLRTRKHPTVTLLEQWGKPMHSYDHLYDSFPSFEALYRAIVDDLIARGKQGDVYYGVPGHPLVAEITVQLLLAQQEVPVRILAGLSGVEATYACIGVDPTHGLQLLDGLALENVQINPELGALVVQIYNRKVAAQAKIALMRSYPDEHEVVLVRAAGVPGEETIERLPLFELDRRPEIDHLTSVYLPPAPAVGLERLRQVVAKLRDPDGGCPWDLEQTPQSLRKFILEEAYETVEAIDEDDEDKIVEELGDLLLQVFLQSQIAQDEERFDLQEVAEGISDKLVFRHPHVFGTEAVEDSAHVLRNWDVLKAQEKAAKGEVVTSRLGQVPPMAALMYADKVMGRAGKAGFDWPTLDEALAKIDEEWLELREALREGREHEIFHELGDLLYALVNVARRAKLDPEDALRQAVRRFMHRFHAMEAIAGENWEQLSLDDRKQLWEQAKRT